MIYKTTANQNDFLDAEKIYHYKKLLMQQKILCYLKTNYEIKNDLVESKIELFVEEDHIKKALDYIK